MKNDEVKKGKTQRCKMPGCKKDTHNEKALFCLEHDRNIRHKGKQAMAGAGAIVLSGLAIVFKKTIGRKL